MPAVHGYVASTAQFSPISTLNGLFFLVLERNFSEFGHSSLPMAKESATAELGQPFPHLRPSPALPIAPNAKQRTWRIVEFKTKCWTSVFYAMPVCPARTLMILMGYANNGHSNQRGFK